MTVDPLAVLDLALGDRELSHGTVRVLAYLVRNLPAGEAAPFKLEALALAAGVTKPTTSTALRVLCARRYLARRRLAGDRRVYVRIEDPAQPIQTNGLTTYPTHAVRTAEHPAT